MEAGFFKSSHIHTYAYIAIVCMHIAMHVYAYISVWQQCMLQLATHTYSHAPMHG